MFRFAWGNGPITDLDAYRAVSVPNTVVHETETPLLDGMRYAHVRVGHRPDGSPPNQTDWTWYTAYRDALVAAEARAERIRGIAIDEVIPNDEQVPVLRQKMTNVEYWCQDKGVRRPDWVVAVAPGHPLALAFVVDQLQQAFGGRVWFFAETYLATYKGDDFGLAQARGMLDVFRMVQNRTIYAFNHSHKGPVAAYYNAYGTDPATPNPALAAAVATFCQDVVAVGEPFGFGCWTPGYSSAISRADLDAAWAAVGA